MTENRLLTNKHILILFDDQIENNDKVDYIRNNFCGKVIRNKQQYELTEISPNAIIYMTGDVDKNISLIKNDFCIIRELSYNYSLCAYNFISINKVPINIHNVGIFFNDFFDGKDYFNSIKTEHKFQYLTESNKPTKAFRKGIYLSNVEKINDNLYFNLLRCSSNLTGPTDNFRKTDKKILEETNFISRQFFEQPVKLNHVLAQIYENKKPSIFYLYFIVFVNFIWMLCSKRRYYQHKIKDTKAKIKAHSDKTKDMPKNGILAFCSFYDDNVKIKNDDAYTKIHFRLKSSVTDINYVKEFTITLYPNSLLLIPLSTNRLYTHEIKPSNLPVDKMPTRMGYVIRCSDTKAVFMNNKTYIHEDNLDKPLENINENDEKINNLRTLYFRENTTTDIIDYGKIYFSMNSGDYKKPIL